jgi:hypothetical protein
MAPFDTVLVTNAVSLVPAPIHNKSIDTRHSTHPSPLGFEAGLIPRGWGYAVFNYDPASDKFTADAKSPSDCGYACHTPVKAKDYIFHPYEKR